MKLASVFLLSLTGLLTSSALAGDLPYLEEGPWDEVGLTRSSWPVLPSKAWLSPFAGLGAYIYLIDDGVDTTHDDLRGRVTSADINPAHFGNMRHGTAVAGVAAGTRYGVAKKARVIDVYGVTSPSSKTDVFNDALEWTLDDIVSYERQNVSVVNVSLSLAKRMTCPSNLETSFRRLYEAGIPVVVSAGDNSVPATMVCPAQLDTVITVSGMMTFWSGLMRAWGSNYGPTVDLFALSENIVVPVSHISDTDQYAPMRGTSVAAAHASGMIAALLARDERFGSMTPRQLKRWLQVEAHRMGMRDGRGEPNTPLVFTEDPELWQRGVGGLLTAGFFVGMAFVTMAVLIVTFDALMALIEGLPSIDNVRGMV